MSKKHSLAKAIFFLVLGILLMFAEFSAAQEVQVADIPPTLVRESVAALPSAPIRELLAKGVHPRLRWGRFPDFQPQLQQLYERNGFNPLWIRDGGPTPQARIIAASLGKANQNGLDPADYDADLLGREVKSVTPATKPREIASLDVALSLSAMRYLSSLYLGRVNPRRANFGFSIEQKKVDLSVLIEKISRSDNPQGLVEGMAPKLPLYGRLKEALARYRTLSGLEVPAMSFGRKLSPGGHHKDIPALRRYLAAIGDLKEPQAETADSELYDPALVAAVKSFQERHGLATDGIIGKGTVTALQIPTADRINQIQLGLERLRWLPSELLAPYLVVNIPSFELYGSRNGEGLGHQDLKMNVIVGQATSGRNTPVFHADMTYVTFHPYWNVPSTIAAKELVPALQRNPGYLARHNMEIVSGYSARAAVYAPTSQNIARLASGSLRIRQRPGAANALGLVKFAFPNDNSIYLHSTPSKGLFNRARRDFSHGCIRVQEPSKLAEWVLAEEEGWTRKRIESAMAARAPRTVTLKKPIPVYVFYSTVLADEDGRVRFFEDIYGHDRTLAKLLAKGFPYSS